MPRPHRALFAMLASAIMVVSPFAGLPLVSADNTVRDGSLLYAEPDWNSQVLGTLPGDVAVTLDGPPQGPFYPITINGQQGWVNGTNLNIDKSATVNQQPPAGDQAAAPNSTDTTTPADAAQAPDTTAPADSTTTTADTTTPADAAPNATDMAADTNPPADAAPALVADANATTPDPSTTNAVDASGANGQVGPVSADYGAPADDNLAQDTTNANAFENPATPAPDVAPADAAPVNTPDPTPNASTVNGPGSLPPVTTDDNGETVIEAPPAASFEPSPASDAVADQAPPPAPAPADQANGQIGGPEPGIPVPAVAPDQTGQTGAGTNTAPAAGTPAPADNQAAPPAADQPTGTPAPTPTSTPDPAPATATPTPDGQHIAPNVPPVSNETETPTPKPDTKPAKTPEPTPTATPEPTLSVDGPATAKWNAPLMAWADDNADLIFTVPAGSTVQLLGQTDHGWVYANYMEMIGWMTLDSLEPAAPVADETADQDPEDVKTPKAGAGTAWTTVDLSLRTGPSANEDAITTIPANTRVDLTGVMENGFQRVDYKGEVGWIANEFLSLPSDPKPGQTSSNVKKSYTEKQILGYIDAAAKKYNQNSGDMERVARCESNLDPYAVNQSGSYGLFQFVRSTWETTPFSDKDIFDPKWNSLAAGWMWQQGRKSEWVCQ